MNVSCLLLNNASFHRKTLFQLRSKDVGIHVVAFSISRQLRRLFSAMTHVNLVLVKSFENPNNSFTSCENYR